MRIGVVTDTHVGEHLPALPPEVASALAGVDLIIHAGDLTVPSVLDDLRRVAPVVAVRGNHDDEAGYRDLPERLVVRAGGARIGVTHGTRSAAVEHLGGVVSLAAGRPEMLGFERAMRRRFGAVDAVVVGHIHMPVSRVIDGALLFSPGAVFVPEAHPWFNWHSVGGRAYRRFRRSLPPDARVPAVGVLEVGPAGVRGRRIVLRAPIRGASVGRPPARAGRP